MRTNLYHILLLISFFAVGLTESNAQIDSLAAPTLNKNLSLKDSLVSPIILNDSIKKDSILPPKEAIDAIIDHKAEDYILEDVVNKLVTLYDKAEITYNDINIKSGKITIDYKTNIVLAKGIKDSVGEYSQRPIFVQGGEESTQDSIIFNFKTEKAIIYGIRTEQDGIITLGEKTKKMNDSTIFIRGIRFTTSDKKNPDYYLETKKAKIVPNKKIIVGPTRLVIADVPTPVILPFAYLPLTTTKTSGFIIPSYGESSNQGFFLQNGGYYIAGNDFFDLALTGDIYSNSSWGFNAESAYKVRYKYSGRFNFSYENLIFGQQGFDDYSKAKNFNLRWSHSQDSKANPNGRLSASVNLGSSKYFRESLNQVNNSQALTNTLSSSISYYKKFVGTPFNLSVTASHSQNTNTEVITMALPSLQFNMDRIYPFAPKTGSKKGAFQKIGLNYALKADNRITTTDDEFFSQKMFDEAKTGAKHTVSLSTNMKVMKYFTLSPSVNYNETWYFKSLEKTYDSEQREVVTDTIKGFNAFREYSVSAALSTNIYGLYQINGKKLKAIRHVLRPSVSLSYKPDFSFYYEDVQQSEDPEDLLNYSPYQGGIYGTPSTGLSNSIGISLANTLEAKLAPKEDDPEQEDRKIKLLNNLNLSTSYNMAADTLKWSPVSLSAGTQLFKNKLSLNMGATLDPYAINANGKKYNVFNINNNGSLFRLTRANLTMSYSLSSKDLTAEGKSKPADENAANTQNTDLFGKNLGDNRTEETPKEEDDEDKTVKLYHNAIPWSLRLSYSSTYSNGARQNEISNNTLMFSGDLELTPKWQVGASSGYDFKNQGFSYTQIRISRDLDSWKLNFNWVPFGTRTSYYFFIGVKSPMLSDLKWDKRKVPDKRLF
ncbi:putative LPS assembly protein LptD [Flavicella sediminum]|uniref:putative LPS assembly protein LptD n=1 Tax=Flavicella sediminum TaxID=2585141 RepID=UPI001FB7BBFC|nr:putative LPS assembly protein LptD [Flavicella sediminum]